MTAGWQDGRRARRALRARHFVSTVETSSRPAARRSGARLTQHFRSSQLRPRLRVRNHRIMPRLRCSRVSVRDRLQVVIIYILTAGVFVRSRDARGSDSAARARLWPPKPCEGSITGICELVDPWPPAGRSACTEISSTRLTWCGSASSRAYIRRSLKCMHGAYAAGHCALQQLALPSF
jgi:hypothetical protein